MSASRFFILGNSQSSLEPPLAQPMGRSGTHHVVPECDGHLGLTTF